MATLLKVLNNLADIRSAGGVALHVRTQGESARRHGNSCWPRSSNSLTVFGVAGYIIAKLTNNLTAGGFSLHGFPMLVLWAVVVWRTLEAPYGEGFSELRLITQPKGFSRRLPSPHGKSCWRRSSISSWSISSPGYFIAWLTNNITDDGFSLSGGLTFVLFAVIIGYFLIAQRYRGGSLWRRILRISP